MSRQRVLLTTDVVGGVWDFCLTLAMALQRADAAEVVVLAIGDPSATQRAQALESGAQLLSKPLKLEWMQGSERDVVETRQLVAQVVRDVQADLLHANQFAAACADVDVPVVLTLHSDVLSWNRWTNGPAHKTAPHWQAYARLVRQALQRADEVVAVTRFLADEVRSLYDVQRSVRVIHNGWPASSPVPARGKPEKITLLAGRAWDSAKNVGLAAQAAQGWDPGPIHLAGAQIHPESGAGAPVQPPLQPLGFLARAELDAWLRRAAIYLSAARYDPFGLLPLQAALNGCALLLSDIPSYRELWEGAACFFRPDDVADLRLQWQHLLGNAELMADLAQRASDVARRRYTPARMAEAYTDVYARIGQRAAA